ncbi:MAG TPA: ABC transporter permease [Thermomicrobiales bacterium]|nr:ABC transporter permease [Thermomicrobiales bacterium]
MAASDTKTLAATSRAARSERASRAGRGLWAGVLRQRLAVIGLVIVGFFAIVALIGPMVAPSGPTEQFSEYRLQGPSSEFWFGNDEFGRDVFSRLLYGARISFQVGVIAVGISAMIGVLIGLVAGYFGGWVDNIASLLMDVLYSFPTILLAIAIMAMLGNSLANVMIAIGIVNAPTFMRVIRGAVLSVRRTTYVEAAISVGGSTSRVMWKHVLPNVTAPLIVHASLNFAYAVLAEASLAFLGLGNRPPSPSWGSMVSSSYGFLQLAPWAAIFPGVAIALTVLGFNLLGDGLRDALDPRLRNENG